MSGRSLLLKAVRWVLTAVAVAAILLVVLAVGPAVFGRSTFIVVGGSMEPAIPVGSAAVTEPVRFGQVREGDVLTFITRQEEVVTHRVVEVVSDNLGPGFRMQGDANEDPDREIVRPVNVLGRVEYHLPLAGYILHLANQTLTRMALIIIALVLAALQLQGALGRKVDQATAAEASTTPEPQIQGARERQ